MKTTLVVCSVLALFIHPFKGNGQTVGKWEILFDGSNLDKWQTSKKTNTGWIVKDKVLELSPNNIGKGEGRDLITKEKYGDFEFEFSFKISKGANTGVKYLLNNLKDLKGRSSLVGPEYQIIDDENYPGPAESKTPDGLTGASYLLYAANKKKKFNVNDWNSGKIKINKHKVGHWLNGKKILSYDLGSKGFKDKVAKSKFSAYPDFAKAEGYILLQDHGDVVQFKDIRIKRLR